MRKVKFLTLAIMLLLASSAANAQVTPEASYWAMSKFTHSATMGGGQRVNIFCENR